MYLVIAEKPSVSRAIARVIRAENSIPIENEI